MWRLGFFVHEMAFGLLSVFLPLYVIRIGGSLVDVGIMAAVALFLTIPASFFWGYIADRTRRYKVYILLSFGASAILLYSFTAATNVGLLIVLYATMAIFHVAHEAPKNVLIAESYSHDAWQKEFAHYEGVTEVGLLIGLLLGFAMSTLEFGGSNTLLLCAGLNFAALIFASALVRDPVLLFERRLVAVEKTVDFASRGVFLVSRMLDGLSLNERLRRENLGAFCAGLVLFSLATSLMFTPMPVFVDKIVSSAALPSSLVFAIFVLSSGGGVLGYFIAGRRSNPEIGEAGIGRIVLLRSFLAFVLITVSQVFAVAYVVALTTAVLVLMALLYALFIVNVLSLSMELVPAGRAGLFNVLVSVGGACGSFAGPFLAQTFGFTYVFLVGGIIFSVAYVAFKIFA